LQHNAFYDVLLAIIDVIIHKQHDITRFDVIGYQFESQRHFSTGTGDTREDVRESAQRVDNIIRAQRFTAFIYFRQRRGTSHSECFNRYITIHKHIIVVAHDVYVFVNVVFKELQFRYKSLYVGDTYVIILIHIDEYFIHTCLTQHHVTEVGLVYDDIEHDTCIFPDVALITGHLLAYHVPCLFLYVRNNLVIEGLYIFYVSLEQYVVMTLKGYQWYIRDRFKKVENIIQIDVAYPMRYKCRVKLQYIASKLIEFIFELCGFHYFLKVK
jgi:hypothetical protein